MKLLVISASFPPMRAGEAEHVVHLCRHLAARGIDVDVLTTKGATPIGSPMVTIHDVMEHWSWSELPRLVNILRRHRPDGVLLMYSGWIYKRHPMITFAATLTHWLLPRTSFVTQFAISGGADATGWAARMLRRVAKGIAGMKDVDWEFGTLLRDSDAVISMSEHHERTFVEHLAGVKQKSIVVPPPPLMHFSPVADGDTRRAARESLGVGPQEFLLAFYGYIYPDKGVDALMHALQIVSETRKNVRLVVIGGTEGGFETGSAYFREICALPETLGIADRVVWTGPYDSDGDFASRCLRAADACVMPFTAGVTLNRSSFVAAAAHGLPIISTRAGVLEPQFVDGANVMLCPPNDAAAIARAIKALIDSPTLQRRLSDGALRISEQWFSWDSALDRTLAALQSRR